MKERETYIDIAKGIGIILVVIGHLHGINHIIHDFFYLFHMPLFFIISGYLYNHNNIIPLKTFIKHKIKRLIIPFLFFWLGPCLILSTRLNNPLKYDWFSWVTHESFFDSPIWFLWVLFGVCLIFKFITRYKITICSLLAITTYYIGTRFHIPLFIDTIFLCLFYYSIGNAFRNHLRDILQLSSKTYYWIAFILLAAQVIFEKSQINYRSFEFENINMITLVTCAILGSYITIVLSQKIHGIAAYILTFIGQNTMLIICTHTLFIHFLETITTKYYNLGNHPHIIFLLLIPIYIFLIPLSNRYLTFLFGGKK